MAEATSPTSSTLSTAQQARVERNRQRALMLRRARIQAQPYTKQFKSEKDRLCSKVIRVHGSKFIDTGGGFLLDENDLEEEQTSPKKLVSDPGAILDPYKPLCEECQKPITYSYLVNQFDYPVCDGCRDKEDKHVLITKSEAKTEFLLKDCDFDKREPSLKFILRPNPYNPRWGQMKLFLRLQVEKRAMEVWESEEKLEERRNQLEENREKFQIKKFNKQVKALRMSVRSSLYTRDTGGHTHEYGEETYNEEEDTYTKTCKSCGQTQTYEKM